MTRILSLIIILFLCANGYAKNGIYSTLEGGLSTHTDLPSAQSIGAESQHNSQPSGYRFALGYNHDVTHYLGLGLEAGLGEYGNIQYSYAAYSKKIHSSVSEFLIALQWHICQWDVITKIGGTRHKIQITKPIQDEDETQINLMTGLTLAYNLTEHWALLGSYNYVKGQTTNNFDILSGKSVGLNEYLLGIRYRF